MLTNNSISIQNASYKPKQANATPVFKNKGSVDILTIYTPVSLTSSLGKNMDKSIVYV